MALSEIHANYHGHFRNSHLSPPARYHFPREPLYSLVRTFQSESANEKGPEKFARKDQMEGQESDDTKQSTADMTAFVQNLLQQMQSRFQVMSESIVSKIDDMGSRIEELEKSINDLKSEMGVEGAPSPLPPANANSDESKPADGSA